MWTFLLLVTALTTGAAAMAETPFHGSWSFSLPDGNPVWLRVHGAGEELETEMLWSVGSARPVEQLKIEKDEISFVRKRNWKPGGEEVWVLEGPFRGAVEEDGLLTLETRHHPKGKPEDLERLVLRGKKMPPLPPRPDLAKVKFAPAEDLFDGKTLKGWKLSNPKKKNGWSAVDGVLVNESPKKDFSGWGDFGNLVTEEVFEDFRLTLEYQVPKDGNSGVYLRGMYEAQVVDRDSRMQGISGPGALFGRIEPTKNAAKPGGEWNKYEITLVDRHVTIVLNGEKVIDNQPVLGCTGGGISSDDTRPGPIFLQGDHTSVKYRGIRLERRVKSEE